MAKRRKRRSPARSAKGRFVKKSHRKTKARHVRRRRRSGRPAGARPHMGYVVGSRKIRRLKLNPRRRRYRRNPFNVGGIVSNQLIPALYGAGGAVALNLALSYLPLPDAVKTGWGRHGVRIVGALGIGWLAHRFVKGKTGDAVAAGALTVVMYDIVKAALAQFAPEIGSRLGEFEDVSLSGDGEYYDPASYITDESVSGYLDGSPGDGEVDNMGAYMEGDLDGVGAYMEGGDI